MLGLCYFAHTGIRCQECFYFMDSATQFKSRPCSASMWPFTGSLVVLMAGDQLHVSLLCVESLVHFRNGRVRGKLRCCCQHS